MLTLLVINMAYVGKSVKLPLLSSDLTKIKVLGIFYEKFPIESNPVITPLTGMNILCRYKRVLL